VTSAITIGIPRERKDRERRIVLTPSSASLVRSRGYRVLIEAGAGRGAGFEDDAYRAVGAEIVPTAEDGKPFVAGVPEGYGGSYFDEMWKNGRQTDRYYMRYRAEK
jgi:hypothetical protein